MGVYNKKKIFKYKWDRKVFNDGIIELLEVLYIIGVFFVLIIFLVIN